jgi:methylated-DNA-[protein]-cysteine S-methyltransferase
VFFNKSIKLDALFLVSYEYNVKGKMVTLNSIDIFKTQKDLTSYLQETNLDINEEKDETERKIIQELKTLIDNYLSGEKLNLFEEIQTINVDLNLSEKFSTSFSRKVIEELVKVKYGETTNYSDIAEHVGSKAFRAVGSVLKKNPFPLIIPCHRVIKKNGKIGGFMGVHNGNDNWQQNLKRDLLEMEQQ